MPIDEKIQAIGVAALFLPLMAPLGSAALTASTVEFGTLVAGATGTIYVNFTGDATTNVTPGGAILVTFPAGFDVSGAAGNGACGTLPGMAAVVAGTTVSGQVVNITIGAGGSNSIGTSGHACSISNVKNKNVTGASGNFGLEILNNTWVQKGVNAAIAGSTLTVGAATSVTVTPSPLTAGATSTATVSFTTANPIPNDGKIVVWFPNEFDISGVAAGDGACSSMDGSIAAAVAGNEVTLTRLGGTYEPAGAQTCTISNVVNPATTGATGTFSLNNTTGTNVDIDQRLAVSSVTITAAASSSGSATKTGKGPGPTTSTSTGAKSGSEGQSSPKKLQQHTFKFSGTRGILELVVDLPEAGPAGFTSTTTTKPPTDLPPGYQAFDFVIDIRQTWGEKASAAIITLGPFPDELFQGKANQVTVMHKGADGEWRQMATTRTVQGLDSTYKFTANNFSPFTVAIAPVAPAPGAEGGPVDEPQPDPESPPGQTTPSAGLLAMLSLLALAVASRRRQSE